MSVTSTAPVDFPSTGLVGQPVSTRVLALDIFRGFTMAVMIFVNDLSSVHGLSRWTYHIPRDVDAMSYVDMVYPFFLFAVGLSLPLAVRQRLRRDPSVPRLWFHILLRCFALLVLGLILANVENVDRTLTHMRGSSWAVLALLGAILLWAVYPETLSRTARNTLRGLGAALLVGMLAIFRRADATTGHTAWLDFSYPEILGLIGLTYLAVCLLYIPFRRFAWTPLAAFGLLLLFNIACIAHWTSLNNLPMYVFPFDNGAMAAITMAGVVISSIFLPNHTGAADGSPTQPRRTPQRQIVLALSLAVTAFVLGLLLKPLGISKIRATPTWALWSIAAAIVFFTAFYVLCDLRHRTAWATLFRAPGANTLLTYLLPDLTYFLLATVGQRRLLGRFNSGLPGITRAVCFTVGILLLSRVLTRAKLRLQL